MMACVPGVAKASGRQFPFPFSEVQDASSSNPGRSARRPRRASRFHAGRVVGGYRHSRRIDFAVVAGGADRPRGRPPVPVQQQHEANGPGDPQFRVGAQEITRLRRRHRLRRRAGSAHGLLEALPVHAVAALHRAKRRLHPIGPDPKLSRHADQYAVGQEQRASLPEDDQHLRLPEQSLCKL